MVADLQEAFKDAGWSKEKGKATVTRTELGVPKAGQEQAMPQQLAPALTPWRRSLLGGAPSWMVPVEQAMGTGKNPSPCYHFKRDWELLSYHYKTEEAPWCWCVSLMVAYVSVLTTRR